MKSFTVTGDTPEKFMRKVERALYKGELGKFSKMVLAMPDAKIAFEKMGVTEFSFKISQDGETFTAQKVDEKVAVTHIFFRNEVERELERIIARFGGTIKK
ncbi:MAG TPA: hypothetical protein PLY93_03445 [Turneriella sp.]|nr:hypothetical protein [Turneriella sp.]